MLTVGGGRDIAGSDGDIVLTNYLRNFAGSDGAIAATSQAATVPATVPAT